MSPHNSSVEDMLRDAASYNDELAEPAVLRAYAESLLSYARDRRLTSLLAATPTAERLIGAALVLDGDYTCAVAREGSAPALVVDINLASGTSLARAAERARRLGATRVDGVVLHWLGGVVPTPDECGVDHLGRLMIRNTVNQRTA